MNKYISVEEVYKLLFNAEEYKIKTDKIGIHFKGTLENIDLLSVTIPDKGAFKDAEYVTNTETLKLLKRYTKKCHSIRAIQVKDNLFFDILEWNKPKTDYLVLDSIQISIDSELDAKLFDRELCLKYASECMINKRDFEKVIRSISGISDNLTIEARKDHIVFRTKEDSPKECYMAKLKMYHGKLKHEKNCKGTFNAIFLLKMVRGLNNEGNLKIKLNNYMPLTIETEYKGIEIKYILAPRVDD